MSESHTRGTLSWRPVTPEGGGGQSAMARVSYGKPFKPYVYRGGEKEPAAVTAARERHRELNAGLARKISQAAARLDALTMPDPEPGYEWHREMRDEQ